MRVIIRFREDRLNEVFTHWKTTSLGLASAFFGFVLFSPELFSAMPWLVAIAKYALVGGLAGMGIVAQDARHKG